MSTARGWILPVLFLTGVLFAPVNAGARPEFARLTGSPCSSCHVSPQGGGPLKPEGEEFRKQMKSLDSSIDPALGVSTGQKLLHIATYLLHIPFGVTWITLFLYSFGPLLRRRRQGIHARPYVRQIVFSAVVVSLTGPVLLATRMRMVPGLFSTRFGVLLIVKVLAVIVLLAATTVLLWNVTVVAARRYKHLVRALDSGSEPDISPEDLQLFNGRDRHKALVAVDAVVYDVTGRNLWRGGIHPGGHLAGRDLTRAFSGAPHGREVFAGFKPVGRLVEGSKARRRGLLAWAAMAGLSASTVIVLVIALWRW